MENIQNSFLVDYQVHINLVKGLQGILSVHELPINSTVQIGDAVCKIFSVQPVIFRYFVRTKKLHLYYDGYRIFHGHHLCLDRLHIKKSVEAVYLSLGIQSPQHLLDSFPSKKIAEFISFENVRDEILNCFTLKLFISHFNENVELSKF